MKIKLKTNYTIVFWRNKRKKAANEFTGVVVWKHFILHVN